MNKFAKALLLALIFAAPVTAFTSEAQAKIIHHTSVKGAKLHQNIHHKNHNFYAKKLTYKTYK